MPCQRKSLSNLDSNSVQASCTWSVSLHAANDEYDQVVFTMLAVVPIKPSRPGIQDEKTVAGPTNVTAIGNVRGEAGPLRTTWHRGDSRVGELAPAPTDANLPHAGTAMPLRAPDHLG